jgi:uncharacterized membrane protein YdjX (TVP38/TMEM64 family)
MHGLNELISEVIGFCRSGGPGLYFTAMAILPVFGFSLFAFVASAGPIFAPVMGIGPVIACGIAALAANVTLSYLLARYALRPSALRWTRRQGWRLPDARRCGAWEMALLVRLIPGPPFGLQSCVLALAGTPFGIYLPTSVAIPSVYFCGMVCVGDGALTHRPWLAAGAGCGLLLVGWMAHRLRLSATSGPA